MTDIFKILSRMVMMAVALYLPSCSKADDMPDTTPVSEEVVLQTRFAITVSSNSSSTRASSYLSEGYDPGEGYENYIDIANGDFAFYFFTDDNNFITKLNVTSVIPEDQTDGSKKYWVLGSVDNKVFNTEDPVKVVALANWGKDKYPNWEEDSEITHTIDDLAEIEYDFSADKMNLSSENKIPLYGVTNPKILDFKPVSVDNDYLAEISMIHMLRAYAKVQVIAGGYTDYKEDFINYEIESVTLTRHNSRGYCAPKKIYSQDDYVTGNYSTDYGKGINIPEDAEVDTGLSFLSASDGSFIAYIPEYQNIGRADDKVARMNIKFKDIENIYELDFCDYSQDNTPFDVQRNYWYQYTVGIKDTGLYVTLDLAPYTSVELKPSFGISRDEDGNIIDKYGNKISFDGNGNQIFRDTVCDNVILIRDKNAKNIIAKCSANTSNNITVNGITVDSKGDMIYYRKNATISDTKITINNSTSSSDEDDTLTHLVTNENVMILVRDEYNEFKADGENYTSLLTDVDIDDVVCIVIDSNKKNLLYTILVNTTSD